jgi:hypothetical protein
VSYLSVAYKVLIASPGDVESERSVIREVISRWNSAHSESKKVVLMPIGWETHSSPEMGDHPQSILNRQIANSCDLLIGVFWTRIGTATDNYASGSVEEIERHMKAGRPTMLFFSNAPVEYGSVDPSQYEKLMAFKASCRDRGVYDQYSDLNDFRQKLDHKLQIKLNDSNIFPGYEHSGSENTVHLPALNDVPKISREAQVLLLEAVKSDGQILRLSAMSGTVVQAGGKNMADDSPRSIAIWDGAVNELEQFRFIQSAGLKRQVFRVTRDGYEAAERFNP